MKKFALFAAVALCAGYVSVASAHVPEGQLYTAFQWPDTHIPVLDGNLSEWDIVPSDYEITLEDHVDANGETDFNFASLNIRMIVSYNANDDKIYFMSERFDDYYDRNGQEGGAGGDDSWEMHHDGDHAGDDMWVSADTFPDPDERALNMGRFAQTYHTRFPELPGSTGEGGATWSWFWVSQSTWHDSPQYMDYGFTIDGEINNGEATTFVEFNRVSWDEFLWNDEANSVIHDMVPEEIIGYGWQIVDHGTEDLDSGGENSPRSWYISGAADAWRTAASATDFLLAPLDPRVDFGSIPQTAVEEATWGRIKEGFVR